MLSAWLHFSCPHRSQKRWPPKVHMTVVHRQPSIPYDGVNLDQVCMVHLEAPRLTTAQTRTKPLKLVASIDLSGSMAGEKLRLMKLALKFMVQELSDKDEFALISFNSTASVIRNLKKMTPGEKQRLDSRIDLLQPKGTTNLSARPIHCHQTDLPNCIPTAPNFSVSVLSSSVHVASNVRPARNVRATVCHYKCMHPALRWSVPLRPALRDATNCG